MHASEGDPQSQRLCAGAGLKRPVEEWFRKALYEVNIDSGVYDYADFAGPNCCWRRCGVDGVRQGAQFAVRGRPEDGGPGVVPHMEYIRTSVDAHGGTTDHWGVRLGARCISEEDDLSSAEYG